jgi:hypothetical protein
LWEDRLLNAESEKDPLALWCKHIEMLQEDEQSSDKLFSALRQCTLLYSQDARYGGDERLVNVWMRYISCCSDRLVSSHEVQLRNNKMKN